MPGSIAAQVVIPIVALLALFGWLVAVLRADTHPGWKHHSNLPKNEVSGGAFQAIEGGRQLMPHYGEHPISGIPAPRTGAEQEAPVMEAPVMEAPVMEATATASHESGGSGDDRHLAAGSKLRLVAGLIPGLAMDVSTRHETSVRAALYCAVNRRGSCHGRSREPFTGSCRCR